jgi:hypothetical protein
VYYGTNISPYKEPVEQFDPLLLVNFWNRLLKSSTDRAGKSDFWTLAIFIAGNYRVLNLRQNQNPYSASSQWRLDEARKKNLFEQTARRLGVEYATSVLTTENLWGDERYWRIVCQMVDSRESTPNQRAFQNLQEAVSFGDIPRELLGSITEAQREPLARFKACELYLYAEMAEAYFLRETLGVRAKIGPQSEEEYDCYLRPDFAIVQMRNPLEFGSQPSAPREVIPYIGRKGQERIWASDIGRDGWAENLQLRLEEAEDFPAGPLDQYRQRLALWKASDETQFFDRLRELAPRTRLVAEIVEFGQKAFGSGNPEVVP